LRSRSHARSRKAMRLRLETWCSTWKSLTIRRKDCPNPSQYTVDVECNTNDKLAGNGAASKAGAAPQRWQLKTSECHSNGGGADGPIRICRLPSLPFLTYHWYSGTKVVTSALQWTI
jgi:hypothetical protein